jgi:phage terminase large subunit-like protein
VNDARLIVPALDPEPWDTLGPEVCDWIEANLVHGPGDLLGQPVRLTDEWRLFLYRCYEVFPRGHDLEGRRRFKRVVLSRRKGVGKTELAAMIAIAELDSTAPVRCDGWRKVGRSYEPVGRPVIDPYVPMVATTEEQTEDLAYGAAYQILAHSPIADAYDIGLERVAPRVGSGKLLPLAGAPNARDGARTTFQHFDETHLFIATRLIRSHATMLRNIPKRRAADPWSLETTTAYEPGEESIAETSHRYAIDVSEGRAKGEPRFLYDHRQASPERKLTIRRELRTAIREASGDAWPFTDLDAIEEQFRDPQVEHGQSVRFWLNIPWRSERKFLELSVWDALEKRKRLRDRPRVVLGFDGSYNRDSTALWAATVEEKPHLFKVAAWERPNDDPGWRTPRNEVMEALATAMSEFDVAELAPDPPGWHREVEEWEDLYGEVVVRFETMQPSRMGPACDDFYQSVHERRLSHDGDVVLRRHLGNAVTQKRRGYEVITKDKPDSPRKIDAAVAAIVAVHRALWHAGQSEEVPLVAWGSS